MLLVVGSAVAQELAQQAAEILDENCAQCHAGSMAMSGPSLASREGALKGAWDAISA